ncbi:MAG: hypothetical protein LCH54_06020 [Bacteroidetes bacterium]|nr:hypothetical protein [Bacteroidota bacterium]
MAGSGFIKQMFESNKENLDQLKKTKLKGFENKHQYEGLDKDLLEKPISDESLKAFKDRAIKNQKKENLKQIIKSSIIIVFVGIVVILMMISFFLRQNR